MIFEDGLLKPVLILRFAKQHGIFTRNSMLFLLKIHIARLMVLLYNTIKKMSLYL